MFARPRLDLEPARPPHGRHARRARRPPRPRGDPARRSSCGRTTRTSATPARPRWARRGELNVGQLVRERHGRRRRARRLHHLQRHRDRGVGLGRAGRAQAVRPALPGSYEALFHDVGVPSLPASTCARRRRRRRAARAAARARDRRHLPAGDRAREPLLPRAPAGQFDAVHPLRRDARRRAARAHRRLGARRAARDLPDRRSEGGDGHERHPLGRLAGIAIGVRRCGS